MRVFGGFFAGGLLPGLAGCCAGGGRGHLVEFELGQGELRRGQAGFCLFKFRLLFLLDSGLDESFGCAFYLWILGICDFLAFKMRWFTLWLCLGLGL